jgi:hypothetical protein
MPHNARVIDGHKAQLRDEGRRLTKAVHEASFVLPTERCVVHVEDGLTIFRSLRPNLHDTSALGHRTTLEKVSNTTDQLRSSVACAGFVSS